MIKAVFFDLDGTLLPMDLNVFFKAYITELAKNMAQYGYTAEGIAKTMLEGVEKMIKNDGSKTNEAVFWDLFAERFGEEARADIPKFEKFYKEDFDKISAACGHNPKARECVKMLHDMGVPTVLATSPVYPEIATVKRLRWAGLEPEDFEYITTYENSSLTKPNPEYYADLAKKTGYKPEECLMVGNDTRDDLSAESVGMQMFILTDDLINRDNIDISKYPHGDFDDLIKHLHSALK